MKTRQKVLSIAAIVFFALSAGPLRAQRGDGSGRGQGTPKPVTVPVTIKLRGKPEEMQFVDLLVKEDGEVQQNLSIRRPSDNPISLAILLQDDLVPSIGTETKGIADFVITRDPKVPQAIHLVGMESPGLTAAPAVAEHVAQLLVETLH